MASWLTWLYHGTVLLMSSCFLDITCYGLANGEWPTLKVIRIHNSSGLLSAPIRTDLEAERFELYTGYTAAYEKGMVLSEATHQQTLIHCDLLDTPWGSLLTSDPNCHCYTNLISYTNDTDDQSLSLRSCDDTLHNTKAMYETVADVIKAGQWRHMMVFADDTTTVQWTREDITLDTITQSGCNYGGESGEMLLSTVPMEGDYTNIVVQCTTQQLVNIINQVNVSALAHRNINWLLLGVPIRQMADILPNLRYYDNVMFLMTTEHAIDGQQYAQHLFQQDSIVTWSTQILWCFMDCARGDAIVSSLALADISSQGMVPLPQDFTHFHGLNLVVTFMEYQPFCFRDSDGRLVGVEVNIVNELAEKFNFTVSFVRSFDGVYGSKTSDGVWTGMVAMVMKREASMAISGIFLQSTRDEVVDYLSSHYEDPTVVTINTQYVKWFYFIKPFSRSVWIALTFLPPFMAIVMTLTSYVALPRQRARTKQEASRRRLMTTLNMFNEYLANNFSALMHHAPTYTVSRWSSRLVVFSWWFTVILITAVYTGNLTASLAVPEFKLPFSTLSELAESEEYVLQVIDGTVAYQLLIDGQTEIFQRLWAKVSSNPEEAIVPNARHGYQKLLTGNYALAYDRIEMINYIAACAECSNFVYLPEFYNRAGFGIVVQERIPYKRKFDKVIQSLVESGIVNQWADFYMARIPPNTGTQIDPVTLKDISLMVQYVLVYGLGMAVMALILEAIGYRLFRRYQANQRKLHPTTMTNGYARPVMPRTKFYSMTYTSR